MNIRVRVRNDPDDGTENVYLIIATDKGKYIVLKPNFYTLVQNDNGTKNKVPIDYPKAAQDCVDMIRSFLYNRCIEIDDVDNATVMMTYSTTTVDEEEVDDNFVPDVDCSKSD